METFKQIQKKGESHNETLPLFIIQLQLLSMHGQSCFIYMPINFLPTAVKPLFKPSRDFLSHSKENPKSFQWQTSVLSLFQHSALTLAPCLSHQLLALSQSGCFSASGFRVFALVSSAWKARSPSHHMSPLACSLSSFSFLKPGFSDCLHIARFKYSSALWDPTNWLMRIGVQKSALFTIQLLILL